MKRTLFWIVLLGLLANQAGAIPNQITYQGTIKEQGVPVSGSRTMLFRLTDATGATVYWSSGNTDIVVTQGLFAAVLSPVGVDWQNITPYVELSVGGQLLLPREPITTNAYSLMSGTVVDGAITTTKIADAAVTTAKLAPSAVTTTQIADGSITAPKLAPGIISTAQLTPGSVTTPIIADAAVTTAKLGTQAVTNINVADHSIQTNHLLDGSVTTAKLAAQAVTNGQIALNAVATSQILDGSVTSTKLGSQSVVTGAIANSAVTNAQIAANSVATAQLMDGSVTLSKLDAGVQGITVPSGLIAIFATACPSGWNRFTGLDGLFPMGGATYGPTGGSATHTHSISTDGAHNHGGQTAGALRGTSENVGTPIGAPTGEYLEDVANQFLERSSPHVHGISVDGAHNHGGATGSASSLPPYVQVVFCQKS